MGDSCSVTKGVRGIYCHILYVLSCFIYTVIYGIYLTYIQIRRVRKIIFDVCYGKWDNESTSTSMNRGM